MKLGIHIDKRKIARLCLRRRVKELSLFGSVLREDFRPDSDVDILIRFRPGEPHSLLDWMDLVDELKAIFGRPVDPVTDRGLRKFERREEILESRQVLYAG